MTTKKNSRTGSNPTFSVDTKVNMVDMSKKASMVCKHLQMQSTINSLIKKCIVLSKTLGFYELSKYQLINTYTRFSLYKSVQTLPFCVTTLHLINTRFVNCLYKE